MLNKFRGCLLGLACGDYLGMPVEFSAGREDVLKFFNGKKLRPLDAENSNSSIRRTPGYYTDDTCMALCLAESLIETGFDTKDQFRRYRNWFLTGYNTPTGSMPYGIGMHTYRILSTIEEDKLPDRLLHNESHGGNGAVMRCAPIGLMYFDDIKALKKNSIHSAIITHNNADAAWSCVVLNSFIAYSLNNLDKNNFADIFLNDHKDCPEKIKELLLIDYQALPEDTCLENSGYTLHTLKIVLYSFFRTKNLEDAITEAVFMGGDSDTQAAIVGSLAGAYYGYDNIPQNWLEVLINRNNIEDLATNLHNKKFNKK